MPPKVLIADELSPRAVEILAARGITAEVMTGLEAAELQRRIAGYDGLAVRSARPKSSFRWWTQTRPRARAKCLTVPRESL